MLTDAFVIGAGLVWLGLLFGTALWAERRPGLLAKQWPAVYSLSLAVYCTSWTFYGTVTQAQRSGWPIPPTFIGTILLYVFGIGLLMRLVRLVREAPGRALDFEIDPFAKRMLLAGTDEIGYVVAKLPEIEAWVHDWAAASALPPVRTPAPSIWN